MNDNGQDKQNLRNQFRRRRVSLDPADRSKWDNEITRRILDLPELQDSRVIFSYLANWGEVSTDETLKAALNGGKIVLTPDPSHKALPADGCYQLESFNESPLTNKYNGPVCHMSEIDIYLVPGIAWDRKGFRIGFGGGYFDRLLEGRKKDSLAIGLAYDLQIVDSVPVESWDQQVDVLITNNETIQCTRR